MTELGEIVAVPVPLPTSEEEELKCEYCKEDEHPLPGGGDSIGSSSKLRQVMYPGVSYKDHQWFAGPFALQAHHLICSEALDDDDWFALCRDFGYDINCKENGVMLPYHMDLACQVAAPLHRSSHAAGEADSLAYPDKVTDLVEKIKRRAKNGDFCSNPSGLVDEMNDISEFILKKVDSFAYTLTSDGADYKQGANGCAGASSVTGKPNTPCPSDRQHNLKHARTNNVIPTKSQALQIGK